MNAPAFSVVTCCYNQGRFLPACFDSVAAQRYPRVEHIVVDDGSTDDTRATCARFPHVRYIHQANAGQSAALNRGFAAASGDIIAWVNSDDYYEPGAFHRVARELDPGRGRWIVAGAAQVVDAEGRFQRLLKNGSVPFFRLLFHPRLYPLDGHMVMPCQPSVFFHRKVWQELGPLDTTLKYGMDYEYWLRALSRGYRFRYVPQIFSDYRYHETSHSNQGFDTFLGEWKAVSDRYYRALPPARRALAEAWWAYARIESAVVGHHKAVLRDLGRADAAAAAQGADAARWPYQLRALMRAPWLGPLFAWRRLRGTPEARLRRATLRAAAGRGWGGP